MPSLAPVKPKPSSVVALTLIWKWLFNSQYGLVNNFLGLFGIDGPDWLGDPVWTKRMIVIMISWKMIGIISIYYIAALKNVPSTYYEAAQLDGATSWQQFRKITLPMLSPTMFMVTILSIINSFQVFDLVNIMTQGGPGRSTNVLVYRIYQEGFQKLQFGYASAMAYFLFIIIMVITLIQFRGQKKWVNYM